MAEIVYSVTKESTKKQQQQQQKRLTTKTCSAAKKGQIFVLQQNFVVFTLFNLGALK